MLVILDQVPVARGEAVMELAAQWYEPLGIEMVSHFTSVAFEPEEPAADGPGGSGYRRLLAEAKEVTGGARPEHADLVYVLTAKDIIGAAGFADCIGGVRYPEVAFAVGEDYRAENLAIGPVRFYVNGTAKIAAHELGHLMGAHHHYANCAEGVANVATLEPAPCTIMANFVDFLSTTWSRLEAAVIRGHAQSFATDTADPPNVERRSMTFSMRGSTAMGRLRAPGSPRCAQEIEVAIERGAEDGWELVATGLTDRQGGYRIELEDTSGDLRAHAYEVQVRSGSRWLRCGAARAV